ncbi:hypothetical protein B5X24_HaOG214379 [Helicoverpa armigera]|nr:hypothetical protein B5X24_HaOG214379 [Helicoverpa armigera]
MSPIKRKTWDHNAMMQGVNAVRRNEMGYLRAAKQFSVPKGTLERYVKKDVRAEDLVQDSSGDEYDAECPYCSGNFSQNTRGEKWAKCQGCFKWAHEECGEVASDNFLCSLCSDM